MKKEHTKIVEPKVNANISAKIPTDVQPLSEQEQAQLKGGTTCCRDKRRPTTIRRYAY